MDHMQYSYEQTNVLPSSDFTFPSAMGIDSLLHKLYRGFKANDIVVFVDIVQ